MTYKGRRFPIQSYQTFFASVINLSIYPLNETIILTATLQPSSVILTRSININPLCDPTYNPYSQAWPLHFDIEGSNNKIQKLHRDNIQGTLIILKTLENNQIIISDILENFADRDPSNHFQNLSIFVYDWELIRKWINLYVLAKHGVECRVYCFKSFITPRLPL